MLDDTASSNKRLSDLEIGFVLGAREYGASFSDIGRKLGRPESTVRKFFERYQERGEVGHHASKGAESKLTDRDKRLMGRKIAVDRTITAKEILEDVELSQAVTVRTIQRHINSLGYVGGWSRKKPFVSETNRLKRLQWARDRLSWSVDDWKRVLWSDESPYTIRGSTRQRVWRLPNERYQPAVTRATVKHDRKIMVWGCFSWYGTGHLHQIHGKMDAAMYKNILIRHMKPSGAKLYGRSPFIFQQDNDPKHTAKVNKRYLSNQAAAGVLEILDWPAQSPDLNPIENLWAIIEARLTKRKCSNEEELFELLLRQWNSIEDELLHNLICSMPRRCQAVIDNNGFPTKY